MNPSVSEIRRRQIPDLFKKEIKWFARGFNQPKTRLEITESTIDEFQTVIWDKPGGDILPTYGKCKVIFDNFLCLSPYKYNMIFKDSQPDKQRSPISMNPFMSKCRLYCLENFYMKIKFHWDKQATPAFILQKFKLVFQ